MTSPNHGPDLGQIVQAAEAGDIRTTLEGTSGGLALEVPEGAVKAGFELAQSRIRSGISEQDAAKFLLLGLSPTESVEILAKNGFVHGALMVVADHQSSHSENGPISVSSGAVKKGFEIAQSRISRGYSEEDAATFMSLGISPVESAHILADEGFIEAVLHIAHEFGVDQLPDSSVSQGYSKRKHVIRNGYSELNAAKFIALSPDRDTYFSQLAKDGFLESAWLLKTACRIEERLSDEVVDSCLTTLEANPHTGMSSMSRVLKEDWDLLANREFPVEPSPQVMLADVAQNPRLFMDRLEILIRRDNQTIARGLNADGWINFE